MDFPAVSRYSPAMREVRKRSYDIMKFDLEKRLSDAEVPIAGYFSGRACAWSRAATH